MACNGAKKRALLPAWAIVAAVGLAACGEVDEDPPAVKDAAAEQDTPVVDTAPEVEVAADVTPVDVLDHDKYTGKCKKGPSICDDSNPCTIDDCDVLVGCTTVVKTCTDSDPCTVDSCDTKTGDCTHIANTCDDGNACTVNACSPSQGCTEQLIDCTDGNACTSDGCTPSFGCQNAPLDCNDFQTCTVDSCDGNSGCVHEKPVGATCCEDPTDCEDGNACTSHTCLGGVRATAPIVNCCQKPADCDDGNPCTLDTCNKGSGLCGHVLVPGIGPGGIQCCAAPADCDDKIACTLDTCTTNQCGHEVVCCKTASDCITAVDLCEAVTCTAAGCASAPKSVCCQDKVVDLAIGGAYAPKLTAAVKGAWSIDQSGKWDATKAGKPLLLYEQKVGPPGAAQLTTAIVTPDKLPAGGTARFSFQWRAALGSSTNQKDLVQLRVLTKVGSWIVWQGGATGSWQTIQINLDGFAARPNTRALQLVFEVQPAVTPTTGKYAMVADPQLKLGCTAPKCAGAGNCNDGLAATTETCSEGVCVYKANSLYCDPTTPPCDDQKVCTSDFCSINQCTFVTIPNCCTQTVDCNDKNVCSTDTCEGNNCQFTKKPAAVCCNGAGDCSDGDLCTLDSCPTVGLGCAHTQTDANCCATVAACNDKDACTVDTCVANQCAHKDVCCKVDLDCKDADDVCTQDLCVANFCQWKPTGAPGCCEKGVFAYDFEAGVPPFFALSATNANVKWQAVTGKQSVSGKGALWYGNLKTGTFDDNGASHKGSVTSQPVDLPQGETLEFAFQLWMDTEFGPPYDALEVKVNVVGGKSYKVWDKHKDKVTPIVTCIQDAQCGNGGKCLAGACKCTQDFQCGNGNLCQAGVCEANAFAMQKWYAVAVNLSAFAGKKVTLEIMFDTIDGIGNQSQGVYVDDLKLQRSCGTATCVDALGCNDKQAMSTEACVGGVCSWKLQ